MENASEDMKQIFNKLLKETEQEAYNKGFNDGIKKKSKEILDVLGVTDLIENHSHRESY
jgi:hypothetical protein